eukprot:400485_1
MMITTFSIIICILSSFLNHPYAQPYDYDVIIMGAGAAGIAAAKNLYEANITNTLIIEANWYVGGRTAVHYFSNYTLGIGASWIAGACTNSSSNECSHYNETNPMLDAALKYNFSFVDSDVTHGTILDFGGMEHNITDSDNSYNKYYDAQDCVQDMIFNTTRFSNPDYISAFAALSLCGWNKPETAIDKTIQWLNLDFYAQHARWSSADSDEFSSGTYSSYGPQDLFITDERGYQGIIKALANEFLDIDDEEKIILRSPITTIQYNENGVIVRLENTSEYSAKYGIVTFPLGVLQSDIVQFIPKLASWKTDALLAFDFIDYVPILVKWPYRFWNNTVVNNSEIIILNDDRFGYFTWIYNLDHSNLYNGSLIW